MYDIKLDYPSSEDLKLLAKLNGKGKELLEDLYKIFSYRKHKEYTMYTDIRNYNPSSDEKMIMELIVIIQKYNQALEKRMSIFEEKKGENQYFSFLYKGMKDMNDLSGKKNNSSTNILENIIPKYKKKQISFDSKFLNRNIFNKSGLLPYTKKETLKFFDEEIQNNGPNSRKSIKSIKFIEKLYDQIEIMSQKLTIGNIKRTFGNAKLKEKEKRMEYFDKLTTYKIQKKKILDDIEEIEKLKKLINIANIRYHKIIEELNSLNIKKHKKKIKITNIGKIKNMAKKINEKNNNKENEDNYNKQKNDKKEIKFDNKEKNLIDKNTINNNENIKITKINNNKINNYFTLTNHIISSGFNRTSSLESFKKLNLLNNRMTETTAFNDFNKTLSKYNNIFNNLNNNSTLNFHKININDKTNKVVIPSIIKYSRNNKSISTLNKNINVIDNRNRTYNNNFYKTNDNINSDSKDKTINNHNYCTSLDKKKTEFIPKKKESKKHKILRKKKINQKNEKNLDKLELFLLRRKKIPAIYEELKSYKDLLRIANKNNNKSSSRIEQLFSELYDNNTIHFFNENTAPKELYKSYYNMKESIEKCHAPKTLFRKFRSNMGDFFKKKIVKSNDQDDELKNKYYDFMQMIIKKKIENDEDEL